MCGIFGISGASNAAELTYLGLYALQHRGQESAGIVSIDPDGTPHHHRGMGLVPDIFKAKRLAQLTGDIAIGHTRYSTTGSSVLANAQPTVVNYHAGPLALAHNGNLVNGRALRTDLVKTGSIFQTSSDTEALVHLIARSDAREPEDQIRDALDRAEGAYTIVMTMGRTMHGLVDPMGFRPLVLGKLGDAWILTSETCALDIVGAKVERELQPGEWVTIENGIVTDQPRLGTAPMRRCVFELIYFSRPDSVVFGESVDRVRRDLGRQLAREHPVPEADCVFSVPDSSNAMALGFADQSGIPLEHGLIRNHYVGRTFINPGQASRTSKVRIKFNPVRDVIENKRVVVVDDSLVRGTTSKGLIHMIRLAGAREVHMRIASPPITGPCHYGIDTPTRRELIAANHTVDQIKAHLGVDSLGYLSLEGTLRAVGGDDDRFCHACFSGRYPTPIPNSDDETHEPVPGDPVTAIAE